MEIYHRRRGHRGGYRAACLIVHRSNSAILQDVISPGRPQVGRADPLFGIQNADI